MPSKDSDQTAQMRSLISDQTTQMRSLIWIFTGHTYVTLSYLELCFSE